MEIYSYFYIDDEHDLSPIFIKVKEEERDLTTLFEKYINNDFIPFHPPTSDYPFTLIEDIRILHWISNRQSEENNLMNAFKGLVEKKFLDRPAESIIERYELLKMLTNEDFRNMYSNHLRHHQAKGFMILDKIDGQVIIKKFALDLKENHKNSKKKQSLNKKMDLPDEKETNNKPGKLPYSCDLCNKFNTILKMKNDTPWPAFFEENQMISFEKLTIARSFLTNERIIMGTQPKDKEFEKLLKIVDYLKRKYKKTSNEIMEICKNVSGTFDCVEEYLIAEETCRQFLVWTSEDDEVLLEAKSANDLKFKLILNYKGSDRIKKRLRFKQIALPFQF